MPIELQYIGHSRERMKFRGVTEANILELLHHYNFSAPGDKAGRMRYSGVLQNGKTLNVVIQPPLDEPGPYTVITVFFKDEG